jgi:hypothetical protein
VVVIGTEVDIATATMADAVETAQPEAAEAPPT